MSASESDIASPSATKIAFGGGCHWCTEAVFAALRGVTKVEQGWVASTGHEDSFSEAVVVHFEPAMIDLAALVEVHLHTHQCTSDHALRHKYRSAVYAFDSAQHARALALLADFQADFADPIITKILPFQAFKPSAEAYQQYYEKNPNKPFCRTHISPKLTLLLDRFSEHVRT
jgi:peptide-methionine (S)-S-oxide reductase